jgi:predicted metalloprotease with PDZ domain
MKTLLCVFCAAVPLLAQEPVRYDVSFPNAAHHEAEVRATFTGVRQPVLEVLISRSSPGRYSLHEFPKQVYNFKATDGQGHALTVAQPFDYQWNVNGHKGTVVVEYTVFGDRADGTFDGIDTTHAHLNMPATFAYAHGFEKNPVSIRFNVPEGSKWKVATQLAPQPDGSWTAPFMDRMMDSPVELSDLTMVEWKTGSAQFRMALHHRGTPEEAAAYAKLIQSVTAEEEGVWGAFPQYDNGNYTFLLDYLPYVNGDGMEHRDSTVIANANGSLQSSASTLINTVAHEFFHSWNVKRIRPKSLEPFDYENPNMSGELWFAEGFTQYYGPLALKRAGLQSIERFTRGMGGAVSAVMTAPGRQIFNVVDMSRHAVFFDGGASNDPTNQANIFISYYTYGQAIALGTDLAIRAQFPGKSLDDWMRAMWKEHPDTQKPYTLDDLQQTLASVTSKEFAADIFNNHVYGKEPMDYEKLLARAGILLRKASTPAIFTGAQGLTFSDAGADITSTLRGSPLYNAGLDRGDRIVEWDGKAVKTQAELNTVLNGHKPGDRIKLQVETRAGKKEVEIELAGPPGYELEPYEMAGKELTPEMKAFRDAWLSSKAIHPAAPPMKYCSVCKRSLAFEYTNCPYDGTALSFIPGDPPESNGPTGGRGGRGGRGRGGQ